MIKYDQNMFKNDKIYQNVSQYTKMMSFVCRPAILGPETFSQSFETFFVVVYELRQKAASKWLAPNGKKKASNSLG